jgi:hypothetical protein
MRERERERARERERDFIRNFPNVIGIYSENASALVYFQYADIIYSEEVSALVCTMHITL